MSELTDSECVPCQGGVPRITGDELREYTEQISAGWTVVDEHHIEAEYEFDDYRGAVEFIRDVSELAEAEGHHPEFVFLYDTVTVKLWTHTIEGLSKNDFVMAAKIDSEHAP